MDDDGLVLYAVFEEDEAELRAAHAAEGEVLRTADSRGWTPILHAAFAGKAKSLRILTALLGPSCLEARTPDGSSAAHLAATEGHVECLQALAALGADLKAADSSGWTALHAAAAAGKVESCQILKDLGLEMGHKTPEGWTPVHCAAFSGAVASLGALQDLGASLEEPDVDGEAPAHKAAAAGQDACLRELHKLGARLDSADQSGRTPAHFAAAEGEAACLKVLHELGVCLGAEDSMGETPMDKADIEEQSECIQLLQRCLDGNAMMPTAAIEAILGGTQAKAISKIFKLAEACAQKGNESLFVEEGGLLGVERELEFEPPEDASEPSLDLELDDVTALALAPLGGDFLQGFPVTLGWRKRRADELRRHGKESGSFCEKDGQAGPPAPAEPALAPVPAEQPESGPEISIADGEPPKDGRR
ncbi:Ankrd44 [Symbiodinium natans]|uniref:Ankrd44 protein n=1 Tax=Symbiodinium natans TaxID=878477 RepID=A0A812NES7_9DINO|nr:Ankrd44 [Symbiodinium natans]